MYFSAVTEHGRIRLNISAGMQFQADPCKTCFILFLMSL